MELIMNTTNFQQFHKHLILNEIEKVSLESMSDEEFTIWYPDFVDTYFQQQLTDHELIKLRNEIWNSELKNFPIVEQRLDKICIDKQESDSYNVTIDNVPYRAIAKCDVLYVGWECDTTAWVVVKDGINQLVTTDHGSPYFETEEFLQDRIATYKQAMIDSEKLLALLK